MNVKSWMAWEGGVDLVAATDTGLEAPNVILHVARVVHTPVGSAPAGIVLYQPDPSAPPAVMGFVCPDPTVGAYFGPQIFAGTPFESAPVLDATIEISVEGSTATSRIAVSGMVFETVLSDLGETKRVDRAPSEMTPFFQQGVEASAGSVQVMVDGTEVPVFVPPVGMSGGPAAVLAAAGAYVREG